MAYSYRATIKRECSAESLVLGLYGSSTGFVRARILTRTNLFNNKSRRLATPASLRYPLGHGELVRRLGRIHPDKNRRDVCATRVLITVELLNIKSRRV